MRSDRIPSRKAASTTRSRTAGLILADLSTMLSISSSDTSNISPCFLMSFSSTHLLPFLSRQSISNDLSKRRWRAKSILFPRFVAAMTNTGLSSLLINPSISVSNTFRTGFGAYEYSRFMPMASISSMNRIAGAYFLAIRNSSCTFPGPPFSSSLALTDRKFTPDCEATTFAREVLPVPGGPYSRTPLGFTPFFLYFFGF